MTYIIYIAVFFLGFYAGCFYAMRKIKRDWKVRFKEHPMIWIDRIDGFELKRKGTSVQRFKRDDEQVVEYRIFTN